MNIIECYQLLNEYFSKKPCFNVKKNRKEIFLVSDDENAENAALICSLKEMEKANVLRSCSLGGEDYWVLVKPLAISLATSLVNNVAAPLAVRFTVATTSAMPWKSRWKKQPTAKTHN